MLCVRSRSRHSLSLIIPGPMPDSDQPHRGGYNANDKFYRTRQVTAIPDLVVKRVVENPQARFLMPTAVSA